MTTRRRFLAHTLGLAALPIAIDDRALAMTEQDAPLASERTNDFLPISLAQWSLHRTLRSGELDNLGFAAFTKRTFDIDAVEYVNSFFAKGATDFAYLRDVGRAADDAGVRNLLIMVDGEGRLGAQDDVERRRAIQRHFKWVAAAASLGCHAVRVNVSGSGDKGEHARLAADSLHQLCEVADEYALSVVVENHGGPSSDGAWLADTIRRADHPRCGTLPDFGNFLVDRDADGAERWYDRYLGVEQLMPFARAVSAKSHDFDADGEETYTNFERMLRIVLDAGYRGHVGIEYEGSRLSEIDGIRATKVLLERTRAALAAEYATDGSTDEPTGEQSDDHR